MKTNLDLARILVRKAESDLAAVRRTIASPGPYDTGLFHCQQAVEKYLFEMHNRSVREAVEKEELSRAALDFNDGCETDTFELEFYWDYTGYPDLNGDLCVLIKTPLLADQLLVGFAPEDRDKLIGI